MHEQSFFSVYNVDKASLLDMARLCLPEHDVAINSRSFWQQPASHRLDILIDSLFVFIWPRVCFASAAGPFSQDALSRHVK